MNRNILSSVDEARLHHQLCPDEVLFENQFDKVLFFSYFEFIYIHLYSIL